MADLLLVFPVRVRVGDTGEVVMSTIARDVEEAARTAVAYGESAAGFRRPCVVVEVGASYEATPYHLVRGTGAAAESPPGGFPLAERTKGLRGG